MEEGETRSCVTNMPGAAPQTSSQAIGAATRHGSTWLAGGNEWRNNQALVRGINVEGGPLANPARRGLKL